MDNAHYARVMRPTVKRGLDSRTGLGKNAHNAFQYCLHLFSPIWLGLLGHRTVGNFPRSNFLWFGELRQFRGFEFLWHTSSNHLVT